MPPGGVLGYDAGKKTKDRKCIILVDTLGFHLGAAVVPADTPERTGAHSPVETVLSLVVSVQMLWVDGGYGGVEFETWVQILASHFDVEVSKRSNFTPRLKVLTKRWVVGCTFARSVRHRRLLLRGG